MRKKLTEEERLARRRESCRKYREKNKEILAEKRHAKRRQQREAGEPTWTQQHPELYRKYMREYMRKLRAKQKSIVKAQQV